MSIVVGIKVQKFTGFQPIFSLNTAYAPRKHTYGIYGITNTSQDRGKVNAIYIKPDGNCEVWATDDILGLEPVQFVYPLKNEN